MTKETEKIEYADPEEQTAQEDTWDGIAEGPLEIKNKGFGFIKTGLPGIEDVFISPLMIRANHLKSGDVVTVKCGPGTGNSYTTVKVLSAVRNGEDLESADSEIDKTATGYLDITEQGYGFLRKGYESTPDDVYVPEQMIRALNLQKGDKVHGKMIIYQDAHNRVNLKLTYVYEVNDEDVGKSINRRQFSRLTPVYPHEKLKMERGPKDLTGRIIDLMSPIGKGQRAIINAQPKAGKTTVLSDIAQSIEQNHPDTDLIVLLIDERPEEVTAFRDRLRGERTEIIASTFDKGPYSHRSAAEFAVNRAKILAEQGRDVVVLLDSLTRLTRAYNKITPNNGAILSGGVNPMAMEPPKSLFGAARCFREGGSLTIIATALVETGSRMDDLIFEEFKGTGNMELSLDRTLANAKAFPAINLPRTSTREDRLLLTREEQIAQTYLSALGDTPLEKLNAAKNYLLKFENNDAFAAKVTEHVTAARAAKR